MSADEPIPTTPKNRVDEEFASRHGSTVSGDALEDEEHPELHAQGLGHKIGAEASEGEGPVDKMKRAFQEIDRDVSGEYESRDDPTSPG